MALAEQRDQNGNQVPKPGHHPGDDHFHYGHCVASCRIQQECLGGRGTAWATGVAKEIWDQIKHIFGNGPGWEGGDMDANREGRSRGRKCPNKSCEEACGGHLYRSIVGFVGYYTFGLHGVAHGTTADEQSGLTFIRIEQARNRLLLNLLKKKYADECTCLSLPYRRSLTP